MTSNTNISSDKSEVQLYEVLLYKKKDIIAIQKKLDIRGDLDVVGHPILTTLYENIQDFDDVTFGKMTLGTLYHLLLYLEKDISVIQDHLGIVGHSDQEISGLEEANKNARVYLQNS
ncbi:hypothetical protein RhiirC2_800894 [Rhizophagus irregularis]|uniref:Uncharacterized protein n=1 Tax=Rhizophagus irregularis TaxID=588596 RepID=A0A2N1M312_9GLOM|nr:hypothetical protein RhiirC2_800894 [Rhizophagus irregularis]